MAPVYAFEQIAELRGRDGHAFARHGGPHEAAPFQPFGVKRQAEPFMPQALDQIATLYLILHTVWGRQSSRTPGIRCAGDGC